jgi:uncharacterized protein (TIGR02118 family)
MTIFLNIHQNQLNMVKLVVVYGHPESPEAFEKYYAETHMPIAGKIPCEKIELTKFLNTPDGQKAAKYRMAELYYHSIPDLQAAMGSEEGKAAVNDLPNFATGGVEVSIAEVA